MCAYIHTGCELSWSHFHFRAFLWSWKPPRIHFIGQRFSTAWWIDTEWDLWFWVCQCGEALWDVHWSKCQTKVITCTVCTCIVYCVFCIALYCVPSLELIQDLHYIKIICFSFFRNWKKNKHSVTCIFYYWIHSDIFFVCLWSEESVTYPKNLILLSIPCQVFLKWTIGIYKVCFIFYFLMIYGNLAKCLVQE